MIESTQKDVSDEPIDVIDIFIKNVCYDLDMRLSRFSQTHKNRIVPEIIACLEKYMSSEEPGNHNTP